MIGVCVCVLCVKGTFETRPGHDFLRICERDGTHCQNLVRRVRVHVRTYVRTFLGHTVLLSAARRSSDHFFFNWKPRPRGSRSNVSHPLAHGSQTTLPYYIYGSIIFSQIGMLWVRVSRT